MSKFQKSVNFGKKFYNKLFVEIIKKNSSRWIRSLKTNHYRCRVFTELFIRFQNIWTKNFKNQRE